MNPDDFISLIKLSERLREDFLAAEAELRDIAQRISTHNQKVSEWWDENVGKDMKEVNVVLLGQTPTAHKLRKPEDSHIIVETHLPRSFSLENGQTAIILKSKQP